MQPATGEHPFLTITPTEQMPQYVVLGQIIQPDMSSAHNLQTMEVFT